MINTISILIPTYNHVCLGLVEKLQAQAASLSNFEYEILVADDGSTDRFTIAENRHIRELPYCRFIEREKNVGRAAIHNFLAKHALHPWLLFIDCNMSVVHPQYLSTYQHTEENDVIYGGYQIKPNPELMQHNLRYIFESRSPQNGDHQLRQAHPYRDFHTSNFLIKRSIIERFPLDERFKHYGYEDVLFGKTLKDNHITITHRDNPLGYEHFVGNMTFISKTEESLHSLQLFKDELRGYSRVITYADKLKSLHLYPVCQKLFPWLSLPIKAKLTGNKPSIFWFDIYKLLYFIHLDS